MMDVSPPLDCALGLFFLIFGPIVTSVAVSQFRQTRDQYQIQGGWRIPAFLLMTVIAALAAIFSGWVYLLEREQRFLLQTLISLVLVIVGAGLLWQARRVNKQPLRVLIVYLDDFLLAIASGTMAVCGGLMLVSFPILLLGNPNPDIRIFIMTIGLIAGFTTIAVMLVSVLFTNPTS
jgi:uncharacterized membrane protein YfcA